MNYLQIFDRNIEKVIVVILLIMMTSLIGTQVFMRYVLQSSSSWTEELIRWFFVWFIWIGISYGFAKRNHVRVTLFVDLFSERVKAIINIILNVIMIIFFLRLTVIGWDQAISPIVARQSSVAFSLPFSHAKVSMFWLYIAMPAGSLLTSIRIFQNLIVDLKNFKSK